ncbi:hypothetical protein BJ165DRAFT_1528462 [Panaeolus papilionaceus]|nr:hypothetical protein BJ165DRAFT_1528462 [Panaeolus papilionaceus]
MSTTSSSPAGFRDITNTTTPAPLKSNNSSKRKNLDENSKPTSFSRFSATPVKKSKAYHSTYTPSTLPSTPIVSPSTHTYAHIFRSSSNTSFPSRDAAIPSHCMAFSRVPNVCRHEEE